MKQNLPEDKPANLTGLYAVPYFPVVWRVLMSAALLGLAILISG